MPPSHDRYTGLSGQITCTLTLEQPTVIGGKRSHTPGQYHRLEQFRFKDRPAIPATSLKGLISSIAEAASLSRYRVLEDEALTVRNGQDPRAFPGKVHDYVDLTLRPLSDPTQTVSLADHMFGFVIDKATGPGSAYAGHVRPSIGTIVSPVAEAFDTSGNYQFDSKSGNWVRLKELSQPMKSWPSTNATKRSATPNFYFRTRNIDSAAFISKADFATGKSDKYEVQGQKAYLHHLQSDNADSQPWKTAASIAQDKKEELGKKPAIDRKTAVQPLNKGVRFTFTLDFDNLTGAMLDLLCFALRPSTAFRHKIGYGKSLGLGSVRIDPVKLVLVDRAKRYCEEPDIFAPRTEACGDFAASVSRHSEWLKQKHPAALKALLLIGETHDFGEDNKLISTDLPPVLWVPLTTEKFGKLKTDAAQAEEKSYEWFSDNDRAIAGNQRLKPIGKDDMKLPVLQTNNRPPPGGGQRARVIAQSGLPSALAGGGQAVHHRNVRGRVNSKGPNLGMITCDRGEISFNQSSVSTAVWNCLQQGDYVHFDIAEGPAGRAAINIQPDD